MNKSVQKKNLGKAGQDFSIPPKATTRKQPSLRLIPKVPNLVDVVKNPAPPVVAGIMPKKHLSQKGKNVDNLTKQLTSGSAISDGRTVDESSVGMPNVARGDDPYGRSEMTTVRFLLYGIASAGKTTFFQQILNSDKEQDPYAGDKGQRLVEKFKAKVPSWIYYDILEGCVRVLMDMLNLPGTKGPILLDHTANPERLLEILDMLRAELCEIQAQDDFPAKGFKLSVQAANAIHTELKDEPVFLEQMHKSFSVTDGFPSLFNEFVHGHLSMSKEHVLLAHVPNSNHTTTYKYNDGFVMEMVDLGGHEAVRDDWLQIKGDGTPDVHMVVYFVSLTDHNKALYSADSDKQDKNVKRTYFDDSLKLWRTIVNHPNYSANSFLLVFTKADRFRQRYVDGDESFSIEALQSNQNKALLNEHRLSPPGSVEKDQLETEVFKFYTSLYKAVVQGDRNVVEFPQPISCLDPKAADDVHTFILKVGAGTYNAMHQTPLVDY